MGDFWNTGWNEGWNVGYNAKKSGQTSPQATPVPTPTQYQAQGDPWNVGWNEGWNKGWNEYKPSETTTGSGGDYPLAPVTNLQQTPQQEQPQQQQQPQQEQVDPYAGIRNEISSGYDAYFANLDQQLASLPGQQANQNTMVDTNYNQGVSDLNLQQSQGMDQFGNQRQELATNQQRNLRSLDENMRNMFMAGNVYLGSRGAGDSSAANQYSYALTREGNRARGDQMSQFQQLTSGIQQRETQLKQTVDNEMNRIRGEADNKKLEVANWFTDAQQRVKDAIANGQLSKSTDLQNLSKSILDQAMTAMQSLQTNTQNQQNSLITWAQNNSKTLGELRTKLQGLNISVPGVNPANMSGNITTDARGNSNTNINLQGMGSQTTDRDIFGQPIKRY